MPSSKAPAKCAKPAKRAKRAEAEHGMKCLQRLFGEDGMNCCVCSKKAVYVNAERVDEYCKMCSNAHVICFACWFEDTNTLKEHAEQYENGVKTCTWTCAVCREVLNIPRGPGYPKKGAGLRT